MKKSSLILITILATTFQSYAKNYPLNLSIVHMNDTHSHFEIKATAIPLALDGGLR